MINQVQCFEGRHYEIGLSHGKANRNLIRLNLKAFRNDVIKMGFNRKSFDLKRAEKELSPWILEEIAGISDGSGLAFKELLEYNIYREIIYPDECSVMMAIGKAAKNGATVFLKNSDKIGDIGLSGPKYYKNKEVNVILNIKAEGKNRVIGVAAAGSVDVKMGLSDKGVAAGTNIARTKALAGKGLSFEQIRVPGRGRLIREALEVSENALTACNITTAKILEAPMASSGNMQFADANEAFIIEGSYSELAVEVVKDKTAARANSFVVMKSLNSEDDVSSICRLTRANQLLRENEGNIDVEMMIKFSMDHANGPGINSICRHSNDPADETTLAAAIMEINKEKPEKSRIAIALGKPCWAWKDKEAHVTLDMTENLANLPQGFTNGETWKRFYSEEPKN